MIEKYCTNCKAEFMMSESFNFCGYCKTNTLIKKDTDQTKGNTFSSEYNQKDYKTKKSSNFLKNIFKEKKNSTSRWNWILNRKKNITLFVILVITAKLFLNFLIYPIHLGIYEFNEFDHDEQRKIYQEYQKNKPEDAPLFTPFEIFNYHYLKIANNFHESGRIIKWLDEASPREGFYFSTDRDLSLYGIKKASFAIHLENLFLYDLYLFLPCLIFFLVLIWLFGDYYWFKKLTKNLTETSKNDEANQIKHTSKVKNESTSNKKEDEIVKSQNKTSSSEIIKKLYPKLKGIDFELISTTPKGESPENFFTSDIDGKWFFSVHNFAMIFKSFSNENYEKGLSDLLKANGLALNAMIEESTHYYIQGDGFKIEKPKSPAINLLIITNEKVAHKEAVKYRSLDKLNEVDVKWIKGINKIYDGNDALSRFNLSKDLKNIPMYFKEDDIDYIAIHIPTLNVAKMIINDLVKKNKFENDFKKFNDEDGWEYIHESDKMVIGYLPEHQAVRINNKLF